MSDLEKAARLALNRLTAAQEWIDDAVRGGHRHHTEIESAGDLWPETVALRAALAQQAEPVAIYHGDCTIDCGNHGHHNVELLKLIAAGTKLYAGPQQAEPVADKAQCDGGSCGVGGYCEQCPKQQAEPVVEPVAWYFQSFEDWWDSHGFHNAFEAGQIDGKPLAKLAWEVAREISAHQQPAPVVEPPKSFRVGYMTGYADGQRELREKQQADPTEGNPSF